ncbi:MAG: helix-turn-helix transcriptional regulator [Clostridia bacterium]|nr:helix-turn-helix transcriptional regulator [Clostridia bacterium]
MDVLEQLVITDVKEPLQVYFERGRRSQMRQRATYGLSLCLDGQITYTLNGQSVTSTKGTAVLLPKGGTYALKGERDGLFWVFNFLCEGFVCEEILAFTLANPAVCQAIASNIRHLYGHDGSRLEILGEFYKLLDRVTRQPTVSHLAPIVGYIEQNLSDATLTNTKIAQRATISEVYLRKLFLQQYHVTPKQFILNRRLQKAKQLLTDTECTVTQVSMECGFSGLYHFCRIFKEKTGMTPSEYAKQFRTFEI